MIAAMLKLEHIKKEKDLLSVPNALKIVIPKTPNDMSDKKTREQILAEIIYREEDNPDFTLNEVLEYIIKGDEYKEPWVDVALEAMQSYAEQHLEDVLVEYQDYIDFNEEHDRNASKSERIKSFLNHLKQRKG